METQLGNLKSDLRRVEKFKQQSGKHEEELAYINKQLE